MSHRFSMLSCAGLLAAALAAPGASAAPLPVAATTTIVGDVVRAVGGPDVEVRVLLPCGADPHAWSPRPAELARLESARLIFINGFDLEGFLRRLLENTGAADRIVSVSEGIAPRRFAPPPGETIAGPAHGADDPHVWFDPIRVARWTANIERRLAALDPAHAAGYAARAAAYRTELERLDAWIRAQVDTLPPERRRLVGDHEAFGYFADRYGFRLDGAVLPGFSTLAQPSARELARLEETIRAARIPAIFTGSIAAPALAEQVARDAGARVVPLYNCSLGPPGGPAGDYLSFMRYDVRAIVEALR